MPLVVAGPDKAEARRLQRMAEQGALRRIYQGIYLVQRLDGGREVNCYQMRQGRIVCDPFRK